jgi:hypothetical protein
MGIIERPSKTFLKSIEDHFHFTPPRNRVMMVKSIKAMMKSESIFALGGIFFCNTRHKLYRRSIATMLTHCSCFTKINRIFDTWRRGIDITLPEP